MKPNPETISGGVAVAAPLATALVLATGAIAGAQTYTNELLDQGGNNWAQYTDIDIDANDNPHVAYTIEHPGGNAHLWYGRFDGSTWSFESRNLGPTVEYCAMELDSNGDPHFAVRVNQYPDYFLNYYKFDNAFGSWSSYAPDSPDIAGGDTLTGLYPDIAINAADDPLISYGWKDDVAAPESDLRIATRTAGSWTVETVDGGADDVGYYTSIALHSSGRPRIAYYDQGNGNLKFARKTAAGGWVRVVVDSLPDVGTWTDIAIDANDDVHISYINEVTRVVRYATNASGSWVTERVPGPNDAVGDGTSLRLDSDGDPHIAYLDTAIQKLRHVKKKAGVWTSDNVDDTFDRGWRPALALDSNDEPHISYFENATSDLYYARLATDVSVTGGLPVAGAPSLVAYPNPAPAGAPVHVLYSRGAGAEGEVTAFAGPVDLAVYDVAGRRVRSLNVSAAFGKLHSDAERAVWDGRNEYGRRASPGVYFIRVGSDENAQTARVHLVR